MKRQGRKRYGFSLIEVVVALGVIGFAIVAILGVIPAGLSTSRSAQDQTRAGQIAQDIFASLQGQAQTRFPYATIKQPGTGFSYDLDLSQSITHKWMSADYDGSLVIVDPSNPADELKHAYQILIAIAPNPSGFDSGYATAVTIRIVTPPSPNPNQSPSTNQTVRDFTRVITKY